MNIKKIDINKILKKFGKPTINDTSGFIFEIVYPEFKNQPILNKFIVEQLKTISIDGVHIKSINQLVLHNVKLYRNRKFDSLYFPPFLIRRKFEVVNQNEDFLTFTMDSDWDCDYPHGWYQFLYYNWGKKRNKKIELEDILVKNYNRRLTKIAEKIFMKNEHLSDKTSLEEYFFENGKFALNYNFMITDVGLSFFYNIYEIKPYSQGPTELDIPYSKIKSLIKPNSILKRYIK
jgi:hypothetical protein